MSVPALHLARLPIWCESASLAVLLAVAALSPFCRPRLPDTAIGADARLAVHSAQSPTPLLQAWQTIEDLPRPIAQFRSVFWEPRDTESLRRRIRETPAVRDKLILEIGTGTGLVALCCLQAGARRVVATDINPAALENVRYNAILLGLDDRLEARLIPLAEPAAFSVIGAGERFDLIVSNPPWEDGRPTTIADYALYDEQFRLLDSLMDGLTQHLSPNGRAWLAYGSTAAVRRVQQRAAERGLDVVVHDDRPLDQLPDVFLPGMLLEVAPQKPAD
jgi:release factor glutamine methyltransferase